MKLTKSERVELQSQASARKRSSRLGACAADSAAADGLTWAEIRAKLDCHDSYIARWSQRFPDDRRARTIQSD